MEEIDTIIRNEALVEKTIIIPSEIERKLIIMVSYNKIKLTEYTNINFT